MVKFNKLGKYDFMSHLFCGDSCSNLHYSEAPAPQLHLASPRKSFSDASEFHLNGVVMPVGMYSQAEVPARTDHCSRNARLN